MAEYFDVLNSVINKNTISEDDIDKHFVPFQAIRWLSNNPMACYAANRVNSARGNKFIPKNAEYSFLKNSIQLPRNTRLYGQKNDKETFILMSVLADHFRTDIDTIKEYLTILKPEDIVKIIETRTMYGNNYVTDPKIIEARKALDIKREKILKEGL